MQHIIEQTIELLKRKNISTFELSAHQSVGTSFSVRMSEVENTVRYENQGLGITIIDAGKSASVSTVDISTKGLQTSIEQVISLASFSSVDEYNTLAPKKRMPAEIIDLDLYYPYDLSKEEGVNLALECEAAALEHAKITNSEGCEAAAFYGSSFYANSHGIILKQDSSSHSLSVSVIASDSNKKDMQTTSEYDNAIKFGDLSSPQSLGHKCAQIVSQKLNPTTIPSGEYPVIFYHTISSSLISSILSALSGSAQYKKSSFLLDSINKIILPEHISIIESPLKKHTIGARYFDGDGVLKKTQKFIENGRVTNYLLSQYSANKLGLKTTGNAGGIGHTEIHSNYITEFQEMIKSIDKGILIDEMFGQGVNIITGDYSKGVSGFMIEKGKISYPVSGITIAGNLKEMYQNIEAIANDIDTRKNIKVGSILISSMSVAGS